MRVAAPAKVNLFLGVGDRLSDGYHAVTTVLHALEFGDEVSIEPHACLELHCDTDLGVSPEDNLAYRAAVAFGEAVGRVPEVRITLHKVVPHGAGLGGGSSDAAAVIAGLSHLWGLLGDERALGVAASLGADVPFFLTSSPAALMTGRGDVLSRSLGGMPGLPVVLVRPPVSVSTAAVYRAFDSSPVVPGDPACVLDALEAGDPGALAGCLANNLEKAAAVVAPEVLTVRSWLQAALGVRGSLLAGSGSATFALCEDDEVALRIADAAQENGWWARATRLGAHGARLLAD